MRNGFFRPIVVLAAICIAVTGAIALVNDVTHPIIEAAAAEGAREAMQVIIPGADVFEPLDTDGFKDVPEAFMAMDDAGGLLGYIFVATSNGFGGEMRVMLGIDPGGKIMGVRTLQHSETRGFGDYIDHDHPSGFAGSLTGKGSGLEGVDGVTGATVTFKAFVAAVDEAFGAFEAVGN